MTTFKKFATKLYPLLNKQYEISLLSIEELIGKKVVSIRGGFSGYAGVKLIINSIYGNNILSLSRLNSNMHKDTKYSVSYDEIPTSVILLDEFKDLKVGDIFIEHYSERGYCNRDYYKKINNTQAIEPLLRVQNLIKFNPEATVLKQEIKIK